MKTRWSASFVVSRQVAVVVLLLSLEIPVVQGCVSKQPLLPAELTLQAAKKLPYSDDVFILRTSGLGADAAEQSLSGLGNPDVQVTWKHANLPGVLIVRVPDSAPAIVEALNRPPSLPSLAWAQGLVQELRNALAGQQFEAEHDLAIHTASWPSRPATANPNDPLYDRQWSLERIGCPVAWNSIVGSASVKVAVLDGGFQITHEDLSGQFSAGGWDFVHDDDSPTGNELHATHVAGTIGARGNNAIGVTGVCQTVSILPLQILDEGIGHLSTAIPALFYAADRGVDVINCSWGLETNSTALDLSFAALDALYDVVVVAAAGNTGALLEARPFYPASFQYPNLIAVAATDRDDRLAHFSNFDMNLVRIAAPGSEIGGPVPVHDYTLLDGTSAAAALVSGGVALAIAFNESLPPNAQLTNVGCADQLLANGRSLPDLKGKVRNAKCLNVSYLK